ncbi:amidohydrolase family protein [Mucilaginibacter sp. P25]|uniref:Amidohydrolase family protein n=2 Tax=Mucilaginibacter TaxID=423349 RepID=A0AAE6JHW2_9SPHI|nr:MULTISPECIES: amidohydrolase family protein [Mucilaginibacter]QEM05891.1 amidohydrolase family protein [Mucilaginibacter rubeus]QEM18472.1 amidohydrolase family protein [Mucilaginibacter gossypii]QTE36574.1 amidohydrolase family protein [Mucilaginibacter gossypii]QTE44989.1 amidohydrolase family protein [Mucilaginibacter rubeus]QTE51586.1 amidohydrolase family protein [Mucilaginibacter rubeus]
MKSFRADYVFPVYADPIKNGIVTVDDQGKIIAVTDSNKPPSGHVQQVSGVICPGFINTHCHTELSHLKDKVKPKGGLVNFIKDVQSLRSTDQQEVLDAIAKADQEMYDNGIVAVGDISNTNNSVAMKKQSKLYYHTFVETFGFLPEKAAEVFEKALALLNEFKPGSCSITPHAPYSVSKELFKLIKKHSDTNDENLLSIHNQECEDENKFYRYKLGAFLELYEHFGMDISYFKPQARNSVQSIIPLLSNKQKVLLVHNTCTNLKDIYFIKRFDRKINWCFCPNANLYIEGRLPKIDLFVDQGFNITLGTDSLASNSKLCLLSEMRAIQQKFPSISLPRLVEWGTRNGAEYLGIDDEKGTLEAGKTPGLNLISGLDGFKITPETKVKKLI